MGGANRYPVWSADGERVAFQSDREGDLGIFWQKVDGTGPVERPHEGPNKELPIFPIPGLQITSGSHTRRSKDLKPQCGCFLFRTRKPRSLRRSQDRSFGRSAFSPNGQWLAYQSTETGMNQIFVQPFPSTNAKYPPVLNWFEELKQRVPVR